MSSCSRFNPASKCKQRQKDDFPMAFLPDPTTAASEHSSVKKGLTGSRAVQGRFCRNLHVPFQRAQSTKNQKNVPGLHVNPATQLHPAFCAGGSSLSRTNGSRYPPAKLQIVFMFKPQPSLNTASSGVINAGSPWLVYQVSSEVFSKISFVMSSLLFWSPKSCKLQIVFMFALQPSLKM